MAPKRTSSAMSRPSKKSRSVNQVSAVVDAIADSLVLPTDLCTLLKLALPTVLHTNKADRHAYENEVADQAEKALASVQAALEQRHADALKIMDAVIAPAEHQRRIAVKTEAESRLAGLLPKFPALQEAQNVARKAVHDAQSVLRAAQKGAAASEQELKAHVDKKTILSEVFLNELVSLQRGSSASAAGKQAVKKLCKLGKEFSVDDTLLRTFPLTCKKEPSARTEFESMMFTSLRDAIDQQIAGFTQKIAQLELKKADNLAAVAAATDSLEKAETVFAAASGELKSAQGVHTDIANEIMKADDVLSAIWADMKQACDAQDNLASELKNFTDNILATFHQLKEKQPEPEPVEEPATAEAAEPAVVAEAAEPAAPTVLAD